MLKIRFIVVDRTREPFLRQGEAFYMHRLKRYAHTEWVEIKAARIKKGRTSGQILTLEGDSIAKKIRPQDYNIALDRSGQSYSSKGLAQHIERLSHTRSSMGFIIGGPLGLSKRVIEMSDDSLSLTPLTLTHEMARLILLEQLYRAFTIINHEKYHK